MSETLIGSNPDCPDEFTVQAEDKASQLPDPSGYRILCAIPEMDETFDNGIVKADITRQHEELLTTVLFVVKLGPVLLRRQAAFSKWPLVQGRGFCVGSPSRGHPTQDSQSRVQDHQR